MVLNDLHRLTTLGSIDFNYRLALLPGLPEAPSSDDQWRRSC